MTFEEKMSQNGFRLTAPRKKILNILATQKQPISFEEYAILDPEIDKSTFYRTMQRFEAVKMINGIESEDGKRYYELTETLHPHFICQCCHTINCLPPQTITAPKGYTVHSVIFKGICSSCTE